MITTSKRKLRRSSAKIRASRAFGHSALVAPVMEVADIAEVEPKKDDTGRSMIVTPRLLRASPVP